MRASTRAAARASSLSWANAMAFRARRHALDHRVPARALLDIASRLCGLHAQLLSSAELSLWVRVEGLPPDALERALWKDRTLVKTWAMRGTLHLLPSSEYALWQSALGAYRHFLRPGWSKAFGVPAGRIEELLETIGRALHDRKLTREELGGEVARLTRSRAMGDSLRESFGAVLKPASFRGLLCFAPNEGQNVRFTHPSTWLGEQEPRELTDALAEITRRFFAANGPATADDYARWWGGLTPGEVKKRLGALGEELAEIDVEGTRAFLLAGDVAEAKAAKPIGSVRLLPAFDPYVIAATKQVAHLTPGPFKARIYRAQGWISPVLVVDGRMVGVWSHEVKGKRVELQIEPFVKLPGMVKEATEEEGQRLAKFLGASFDLKWTA